MTVSQLLVNEDLNLRVVLMFLCLSAAALFKDIRTETTLRYVPDLVNRMTRC
jgi:hypothetical protein